MYKNIGSKIMGLAQFLFFLEVIGAVISGISLMATDADLAVIGLLVMFLGPIVAWVTSWFIYGFGQLVENSDIIANAYLEAEDVPTAKKMPQKAVAKKPVTGKKNDTVKQTQPKEEAQKQAAPAEALEDADFVDVICPHCDAVLSFAQDQVKKKETVTCPMCEKPFSL